MSQKRRMTFVFGLAAVILIAGIAVYQIVLDPGDKGDTSTDLVTPTVETRAARVFDVSPEKSKVEFVTNVRGVEFQGVFPVKGGTITLEPVGDELQVHVYLEIDVDNVDADALVKPVLRTSMKTGDYPLAFYVAESRTLVPVTEEVITFDLDGELDVHNVTHTHSMAIEAQAVGQEMWAIATSDLDLGQHGVEFPALIDSSTIQLTARLWAYEGGEPAATPTAE
jgi:hypothetical protein